MSEDKLEGEGLKILHIDASDPLQAAEALHTYVVTEGKVVPGGCREEPLEDWMARGRVEGCTCEHLTCVCLINREHELGCKFRRAATCAVPIECEHGSDVCPSCDPCTCNSLNGAPE